VALLLLEVWCFSCALRSAHPSACSGVVLRWGCLLARDGEVQQTGGHTAMGTAVCVGARSASSVCVCLQQANLCAPRLLAKHRSATYKQSSWEGIV